MRSCLVRTLWLVLGLQMGGVAQSGWIQVAATGPSPRWQHAMAYDSQLGRVVLFGGGQGSVKFNETWEWDGSTWNLVAASGPQARTSHAMAYDSQRGRMVLYGGSDSQGAPLGDTWEWDGINWMQVANSGPQARGSHTMAYDSQNGRTLLFGGADTSGSLGDTWEWDGATWQPKLFALGPAARGGHAMAYDAQRGRIVLFGGVEHSGWLGDTWEWDGSNWRQVASVGPVARSGHAMAYDLRGRTVLFGGRTRGVTSLGDTWDWNGSVWTQVASTGPAQRAYHAMAYDSQRARTVLFGGAVGGLLGDTWEWIGFPSSASTFGTGCGNPRLALSPVASAPPTINTTAQASLTNIPSSLAFVALGWSRAAIGSFTLPLPLAGYGMPGCDLLQSAETAAVPVTFTGNGNATFNQPLPNLSILVGVQVYLQGWAHAPGVNAGNTIVSNGVEWVVGS